MREFNDCLDITIIKDIPGLKNIQIQWESMQNHPNAEFDFYHIILEHRPSILSPYVIVLSEKGECRCMLVGRIEMQRPQLSLGYLKISLPALKTLAILYGGIFGSVTDEMAEAAVAAIRKNMRAEGVDQVTINYVKTDSPFVKAVQRAGSFLTSAARSAPNKHWQTTVQESLDAFLKRKFKHSARYKVLIPVRVIEKEITQPVEIKIFDSQGSVHEMCDEVEKIACRTYHRGIGGGFLKNAETIRRYESAARQKRLLGILLYIDNRPVAFWIATLFNRVLFLEFTGYDPDFERLEAGKYLLLKMHDYVAKNKIADIIDYGLGDAAYKHKFGDIFWEETTLRMYALKPKPLIEKCLLYFVNGLFYLFQRTLSRLKLIDSIKKRWRSKAQKTNVAK